MPLRRAGTVPSTGACYDPALQRTAPQELRAAQRPGNESAVLTGDPEHVSSTLLVGVAARDKQEVGQPVDVFQRRRRDVLVGLVLQFHHETLGASAHGARKMQK